MAETWHAPGYPLPVSRSVPSPSGILTIPQHDCTVRFCWDETRKLAQQARAIWENVEFPRSGETPILDLRGKISVYGDREPNIHLPPASTLREKYRNDDGLYVVANVVTDSQVMAFSYIMRQIGVRPVTLVTSMLPEERGERQVPLKEGGVYSGEVEWPMLDPVMEQLSQAGVFRMIKVDDHSPGSKQCALQHGIATLSLSYAPAKITEGVSRRIDKNRGVAVISTDGGALMSNIFAADILSANGYAVNALIEGSKAHMADGSRSIIIPDKAKPYVNGSQVVAMEDSISGGGTASRFASMVHELGATNVVLAATYGYMTNGAHQLINHPYLNLILTDALTPFTDCNKAANITRIGLLNRLGELAKLDQEGLSWYDGQAVDRLWNLGFAHDPNDTYTQCDPKDFQYLHF